VLGAITLLVALGLGNGATAQESSAQGSGIAPPAQTVVPQLMRYSGTAPNRSGDTVEAVFRIYASQQGGEPIWTETQQVRVGSDGKYNVLLGAASEGGLPQAVFADGQGQWLGVSIERGEETGRTKLASVAYAMKAADAETLGGVAAASYVTQAQLASATQALTTTVPTEQASRRVVPDAAPSGSGTPGYLPLWTSASALGDSVLFQSGTGATAKLGIGTATPATRLEVDGATTLRGPVGARPQGTATAALGYSSWPIEFAGSVYDSTTGAPVTQTFSWVVAPFENDTAVAQGYLGLNFAAGANPPKQILAINSVGQIAFAPGQVFPGVAGLPLANTFTATQTVTGASTGLNATATSATGTGVHATAGAYGVYSTASGATGVGVFGSGNWGVQAAGKAYGIFASATDSNGRGIYGTAPLFGVYGVASATTGSTVGVFGSGADGVQGSGTINGVYGASSATGGIGVQGNAPAYGVLGTGTGNDGIGVQGNAPAYGVTGTGTGSGATGVFGHAPRFGVYGVASATTGSTVGVFGSGADGVQGSGSTNGVYGSGPTGVQGDGTVYGVFGSSTTAGARGVYGTAPNFGLYGEATNTSGTAVGVFGSGVDGLQGSGSSYGLYAATTAGLAGAYAYFQRPSATGNSLPYSASFDCHLQFCAGAYILGQAGVWADTNYNGDVTAVGKALPTFAPALLATADATVAGAFINNSQYGPAILAQNTNLSGGGGFGDVIVATGSRGSCGISGGGDVSCTGQLKALAKTQGGSHQVETYSVQSSENWLEDFGSGHLQNGVATIRLEETFAEAANTEVEYHVFLTPRGDTQALYIANESANGFEVRESGNGTHSVAFDYRIVAKRRGHETERLVDVTVRKTRHSLPVEPGENVANAGLTLQ
jgi:hypothetical protein